MIYIASPYSHVDPAAQQARHDAVCRYTGELLRRGVYAYSPIAHTKAIADHYALPHGYAFYRDYNRHMIQTSRGVVVLMLGGWQESVGVTDEIAYAQTVGRGVVYCDPATNLPPIEDAMRSFTCPQCGYFSQYSGQPVPVPLYCERCGVVMQEDTAAPSAPPHPYNRPIDLNYGPAVDAARRMVAEAACDVQHPAPDTPAVVLEKLTAMADDHNRRTYPTGAVRSTDGDGKRFDLIPPRGLRRLAETCHEGSQKYGDHNYRKGFPLSTLCSHAMEHISRYCDGDRSEDHLAHAAWNLFAAMQFEETRPDLCDTWREPDPEPISYAHGRPLYRRQYRHYKGGLYDVQGVAILNAHVPCTMVLYSRVDNDQQFTRPIGEFLEILPNGTLRYEEA